MINTRGWDSIYVPDKVFVEQLIPVNGIPAYEYSPDAPPSLEFIIDNLLNGYYSSYNYLQLFYSVPEVFAPVHEIANRVSDAVWQLRKQNSDEVIYTDQNFNRLFDRPNPLVSTVRQLVYQAVCYEILTGKNFFYKVQPSTVSFDGMGAITNWGNLPAHIIKADIKTNVDPYKITELSDLVIRYREPKLDGSDRIFETKDVLPVVNLSLEKPTDINCAVPLIKGADKAIKNLIAVYIARGAIFIKQGALGLWVSDKQEEGSRTALSPAEKKDAENELNNLYGFGNNKNLVGVARAPMHFERTGMSIAELQPFDETLADALAIYTVLRVPRHFAPNKNNSTFDNASTDEKNFYQNVAIPWAQRYADAWSTFFGLNNAQNYKRYIYADFAHISVLQEDKKDKALVDKTNGDIMLQRFYNGVATLNEWLVAIGSAEMQLPIYTKKLLEMTPEEVQQVKNIVNLKSNAVSNVQSSSTESGSTTGDNRSAVQ